MAKLWFYSISVAFEARGTIYLLFPSPSASVRFLLYSFLLRSNGREYCGSFPFLFFLSFFFFWDISLNFPNWISLQSIFFSLEDIVKDCWWNLQRAKADWMSVPAFGDWDNQKGMPDYSLDFSKVRQMRKQNKLDYSSISIGNDEDLLHGSKVASADSLSGTAVTPEMRHRHSPSPSVSWFFFSIPCFDETLVDLY